MPAIKVIHTGTSDKAWDGPQAKTNLKVGETESYYQHAFAWQDPDADPTTKVAYKFIHHEVSTDGKIGAANIKGCQSACGVLNGGMGGANIPDADRKGVWEHLAAHLKDAGIDAPELRSIPHKYELRQAMDASSLQTLSDACRAVIDTCDEAMERIQTCPNNSIDNYLHGMAVEYIKNCIVYAAIVLRDCETNDTAELADDCEALSDTCERCADVCGYVGDGCDVCADDCSVCVDACAVCSATCDANVAEPDASETAAMPMAMRSVPPVKAIDARYEIRNFKINELRVTDAKDTSPAQLDGYSSVFNVRSEPLLTSDGKQFREVILPGAFKKTIQEADIRALINHDPNLIIGRTKNRTLMLSEDTHGLRINCQVPDTSYGRDLMVSVKRGDMDQMSFAFQAIRDKWVDERTDTGEPELVRYVSECRLADVSPVTYPAYTQTSVYARSRAEAEFRQNQRSAPAQAGHPDETAQAVELELERMRRELAIAEIEI